MPGTKVATHQTQTALSRAFRFFSDFINELNTAGTDHSLVETNSTGSTSAQAADAANHPGIARSTTAASATGRAAVASSVSAIRLGGGEWEFEALVKITALSNATERFQFIIGFLDTLTAANQVDAVAFVYDEGGVSTGSTAAAYWQTLTASNSTRTFNTGLSQQAVGAATWVKLKIVVNAAGTSAAFYINDTLVATHTATIPIAAGRELGFGWLLIKSAGTTARTIDVDYLEVSGNFTTVR